MRPEPGRGRICKIQAGRKAGKKPDVLKSVVILLRPLNISCFVVMIVKMESFVKKRKLSDNSIILVDNREGSVSNNKRH